MLRLLDWQCRRNRKEPVGWRTAVLPPFIIEQIRRREEQQRRRSEQPTVELPVELPAAPPSDRDDDDRDRGVLIVDLG